MPDGAWNGEIFFGILDRVFDAGPFFGIFVLLLIGFWKGNWPWRRKP